MVYMRRRMSVKMWVSIFTIVLLAVVLYLARHEIERAYGVLDEVNLWVLLLLVPLQIISYFAAGEMIFSYLRRQGYVKNVSAFQLPRLALEMNFVNHVLPSGGVSGISYIGWRLKHFGVSASRSTSAQLVRMVAAFASYGALLLLAVVFIALDGTINRWVVAASVGLVLVMLAALVGAVYVLGHRALLQTFARKLARGLNSSLRIITFGRVESVVESSRLQHFFEEVQNDYRFMRRNKKVFVAPFWWGILFSLTDIAMFYVAFLALGHPINPAPLVIAYGLAATAGFFMVTPGGAGAYEAIMVMFLTVAGLNPGIALLAILLTRVLLMIGTIAFGYIFYQQAIMSYGKRKKPPTNI